MSQKHEKYERLLARCKALTPTPTAVAHPCDETSLRGAVEAAELGILKPILVGPRARIEDVAKQHGSDITRFEIVDTPHSQAAAEAALKNPTYEDVCTDKTGHAEAVEISYDPKKITYEQLLNVFWDIPDPTTKNRQGPDVGTQYRSAIFYHTAEQKEVAERSKSNLEQSGKYKKKIVTEITQATIFYPAEEYHQQYLEKHGMAACPR